jgi:hypothetical protein
MKQTGTIVSKAGKGLGVAGMVLSIVAVIISFIPFVGVFAVIFGIIGIILSVVSLIQANKVGAEKGMAVAGLVCSIIGCIIAGFWGYQITKADMLSKKVSKDFIESGLMDSLKNISTKLEDMSIQDSLNKAVQKMQRDADTSATH